MMNGNTIIVGRKLSNQSSKDQPASIENSNRNFNIKDRDHSSRRGSNLMKVMVIRNVDYFSRPKNQNIINVYIFTRNIEVSITFVLS